ncbi:unnamed protein product, partial [marine sediment metagenome]
ITSEILPRFPEGNKYTFWWDEDKSIIENEWVSIPTLEEGWNIDLLYPDGTPNDSLMLGMRENEANTNTSNNDDNFFIKLSSTYAPKRFIEIKGKACSTNNG